MKKIIFFFALIFVSNNVLLSQFVKESYVKQVKHTIFKCIYCNKEWNQEKLVSIQKISDFKIIGCIALYDKTEGGDYYSAQYSKCSSALNKFDYHDLRRMSEESKEVKKEITYCDYSNQLPVDYNWNNYFNVDQLKKYNEHILKVKEVELKKKQEKKDQEKKIKEIENTKIEKSLDSLLSENQYLEAYNYLMKKFQGDRPTVEKWTEADKKKNDFFEAIGRGEIIKENGVDVYAYGRCDKYYECQGGRQANSLYCRGHNEKVNDSTLSTSTKLYNKWNIEIRKYISYLLDQKLIDESKKLIDFYSKKERFVNKQEEETQISSWNEQIKNIEFIRLIDPIVNVPLTNQETILIGSWDFKSKSKSTKEVDKHYIIDAFRFDNDRSFLYRAEERNSKDHKKVESIERTGYWKFENNTLYLYVDFESDSKNKYRVNRIDKIIFSEFSIKKAVKTFELGTFKIKMKGKKRS